MAKRGCRGCCQGCCGLTGARVDRTAKCNGCDYDIKANGMNFQVLLKNYQCGPNTDTWFKLYHDYNTQKDFRGWKNAYQCMKRAKEQGAKAILWTPGWSVKQSHVE